MQLLDEDAEMNLINWTPFNDMDDFFNQFRRHSMGLAENDDSQLAGAMVWRPTADISESKKDYVIKAELPEVEREDVHVSVDGRTVTISGERKMDKEEKEQYLAFIIETGFNIFFLLNHFVEYKTRGNSI